MLSINVAEWSVILVGCKICGKKKEDPRILRKLSVSTCVSIFSKSILNNLVPRAFPFLSLGSREKALAPGGLLCILIGQ